MIVLALAALSALIAYGQYKIAIRRYIHQQEIEKARTILAREIYIAVNELYAGRSLDYRFLGDEHDNHLAQWTVRLGLRDRIGERGYALNPI